jgi:hypothetical protein
MLNSNEWARRFIAKRLNVRLNKKQTVEFQWYAIVAAFVNLQDRYDQLVVELEELTGKLDNH